MSWNCQQDGRFGSAAPNTTKPKWTSWAKTFLLLTARSLGRLSTSAKCLGLESFLGWLLSLMSDGGLGARSRPVVPRPGVVVLARALFWKLHVFLVLKCHLQHPNLNAGTKALTLTSLSGAQPQDLLSKDFPSPDRQKAWLCFNLSILLFGWALEDISTYPQFCSQNAWNIFA